MASENVIKTCNNHYGSNDYVKFEQLAFVVTSPHININQLYSFPQLY